MLKDETYTVDIDSAILDYSNTVYKIALSQTKNKNDADDVFQEVFMRLVSHSHKIQSDEHLKAWLIRVTLNCSKKHFRLWRTGNEELTEDVPYIMPEEQETMQAVLDLPLKYRTVIHLFYYEELTISEISKVLEVKESTVKSQLFRARGILRETLKGEF